MPKKRQKNLVKIMKFLVCTYLSEICAQSRLNSARTRVHVSVTLRTFVNKTKVISADLLDFAFDLDFYFEDIFRFGNISVLVTFHFR